MKERLLRLCARGKVAINVRGLECLQTHPGEDEDTAWRRVQLSLTGRHLDDVYVMLPSAVPATGGSAPPAPSPDGVPPGVAEPTPVGWPAPTPTPVGIFGGGTDEGGATTKPRTPLSNPATSPLNLIGKIEGWGIGPATKVAGVSIKVSTAQGSQMTGAQLKELLKKLPEGLSFELNLEKEDD